MQTTLTPKLSKGAGAQSSLAFGHTGIRLTSRSAYSRNSYDSVGSALSTVLYHPEVSHFSESKFALKFEFSGRSYLVEGTYHLSNTLRFNDDSLERTVDLVVIDGILPYKNGSYKFMAVSHKEETILSAAAKEILGNPYHNPYLTSKFNR